MTRTKQNSAEEEIKFVCDGDSTRLQLSCVGEGFYGQLDGKQYCILHYPDSKDIERFLQAMQKKLKENNLFFDHIYFPVKYIFKGSMPAHDVSFYCTRFTEDVFFTNVEFQTDIHFHNIQVKGDVWFQDVKFLSNVKFSECKFNKSRFYGVEFRSKADFGDIECKSGLTFDNVVFQDYLKFFGHANSQVFPDSPLLRLEWRNVHIEKPERVIFDKALLAPMMSCLLWG